MKRREAAIGLLLAAPAVMGLLAFLVLPFGYTFLRSFTVGLGWGRFVGLENYAQLFGNRLFLLALKNTFLFLACGLALILPLSLLLALLLQKTGKWGKGLAMALLFPMVLPVSAIVIVVNLVFAENGLLSQLTGPTSWMDSPFAFAILLGLYLWKNVGVATVILWLSLLLAVGAVVGQVVISCMGGFAFAFFDFPGKRLLFGLLCFFMLVPLQVTLLPNYLLLDAFGLLNTYWALLLPLAFAPLGTFLLTQIFRSVPADILQAARLDGAGTLQVMVKVLLPCGKSGVSTLIILTLIESWNMVEHPLIYLKDVGSYPLSVFLASRYTENLPLQFVCCVLSLLPLALCFFYCGGDVLDSGIPKEEKA